MQMTIIRNVGGKGPVRGRRPGQPTVSRFENDVAWRDVVRESRSLVDLHCKSAYMQPPEFVILDIDTAFCPTYGEQEGACWSTHHDGHGFAPFHVCDIHTGALVGIALHPAKTPSGEEILPCIRSPSILTMQARQFPSGRYPGAGLWHSCGIRGPLRCAVSQMVRPLSASTSSPSSANFTVSDILRSLPTGHAAKVANGRQDGV